MAVPSNRLLELKKAWALFISCSMPIYLTVFNENFNFIQIISNFNTVMSI